MVHVAEAGEDRGRVVLALNSSGDLPNVALESAVRMAQAFHSELESVFVDDEQLYDLAAFPFAQEISISGDRSRGLSPDLLKKDVAATASRLEQRVTAAAAVSRVRSRSRTVQGEPVSSLAAACAEKGPWNVVTLGATYSGQQAEHLATLYRNVDATTGFVLSGANARRTGGPVVGLVEDIDLVPGVLRAVERLARTTGGRAHLWLLDDDADQLAWLEAQVRLTLGLKLAAVTVQTVDMTQTSIEDLGRRLSAIQAGFTIARFGGRIAPFDEDCEMCTVALADLLEGPLFIVR